MRKIYLLCFSLLLIFKIAAAQQGNTKLISVNFQQAPINVVVTDIESKSGYHFYYDARQLDSLKITLQANNKTVENILDIAFQNTDLHYAITAQMQVFITKGRQIQTELAEGFIPGKPVSTVAAKTSTAAIADYTEDK